ncbi:MAG: RidA family protein [Flavobacteriaceae bacterium]|nr:RidA family protein [Bacteroidia bacterium]NNF83439.1 RidA family protein [Flavobacteriaceae bacterium]NNK69447.1 RidA family protein [Flavobacteriaceae bacterium]NNL81226.1 RidA family protein [Flavobacteriaceae bacterium]
MNRTNQFLCCLIAVILFSCNHNSNPIFHNSHEPKRQNTPFSDVVETDDLMFLAGQIGRDHDKGFVVEGGIKAETRQAIENIKAVLEHHELGLERVVKCTVILSDIKDFADFNEVYMIYFPNKPARTTFAASGLAASAKIEIDVIAAK